MNLKVIDKLIATSESWQDLFNTLVKDKSYNNTFKGHVFERLTQIYLQIIPEYKSILKHVWLGKDAPSNILKKLNLPKDDMGIDLIAETKKGEYWSIQSKFRANQNNALTYKELSTFNSLSFVTASNISLAIVSHTSSKPIRNKQLLKNVTEIGIQRWLDLSDKDWSDIRQVCKRKPIKLYRRKPKLHQKKAIKAAKDHFIENSKERGRLIMPCATGKSLTAFWIANAFEAKKIIVAVPSLALVKQSLNDWTKEYLAHGITPDWLCICSDISVGNLDTDEFDTDVYDMGIPTTTNKETISNFLKQKSSKPKVIFTTYQSSKKLAEAAKINNTVFDLAILDEAHKTAGLKDKVFSTLLFSKNIKIKKRLFMTATERVFSGNNDRVVSMSDEAVYGRCFHQMSFKEAIEKNIISDYKIITMAVTDSQIEELIENNKLLDINDSDIHDAEAAPLAAGIALKQVFKKQKIKHAISFHKSIKSANLFRKQQDNLNSYKKSGPKIVNSHISSKKSSGERATLLSNFANEKRSLITNARCLTEGVDIPAIDCVLFADPKQSVIDIVQAAGRALRVHSNKKFGYILLPLVIPDNLDINEFAKDTAFKQILRIIAALSTQDSRIAEELKILTSGKKSKGKIIDIKSNILLGSEISLDDLSKSIATKIWEKVALVNFLPFSQAREYASSLNIKNQRDWQEYSYRSAKKPADIPSHPNEVYKHEGWESWGDWLGTATIGNTERNFREFKSARNFVRSLKLKNISELREYNKSGKRPIDIPANPHWYDQFKGIPDWLGTGSHKAGEWRQFNEARSYMHEQNFKTFKDVKSAYKKGLLPEDIPVGANIVYGDSFISMGDWLGTGRIADKYKKFMTYKQAKKYIKNLNIRTASEWRTFSKSDKKPSDIPSGASRYYKDKGWVSWNDFLGNVS